MSTPPRPRQPQLPPFCRRAYRCHTLVSITSLRQLQRLLWLALIFQVSTVLLVIAGPVPPRLQAVSTNSPFPAAAGVAASGAQPISSTSDR